MVSPFLSRRSILLIRFDWPELVESSGSANNLTANGSVCPLVQLEVEGVYAKFGGRERSCKGALGLFSELCDGDGGAGDWSSLNGRFLMFGLWSEGKEGGWRT